LDHLRTQLRVFPHYTYMWITDQFSETKTEDPKHSQTWRILLEAQLPQVVVKVKLSLCLTGRYSPGTHWVGPKAGLDAVAKRKISSLPLPETEPGSSDPQPSQCTNWTAATKWL